MSLNTGLFIVKQPAMSPLPVEPSMGEGGGSRERVEGGIRTPNQREQPLIS